MARLFACLRTAVVAPLFISLWTWLIPRWFRGGAAFAVSRPAGWLLIAAGAAIVLPSISLFAWRGLGTPAPFDPPRRLVVTGPYRFVRNPMYFGFVLLLAGEAIAYPNITRLMIGTIAAFLIMASTFVTAFEEPALRAKFGGDYEKYCRRVRRWIPRLTPFDNGANAAVQ